MMLELPNVVGPGLVVDLTTLPKGLRRTELDVTLLLQGAAGGELGHLEALQSAQGETTDLPTVVGASVRL